ncbi:FKBP-type peptidyl-prolyl cis-trans isomerase [Aurantibacter aestuarii]|uniref:peptidylprolyl isomerase n=1 Tax=Aurantibacter aestuarii TaxID=1266046 RepID=A0A2T1N862_9FLAO|nr:hypothetical protein [Aurantibacter aestuarii]PSG88032.1 hypothetical protein C7H52_06935 [Aurantibacter aestuarii]
MKLSKITILGLVLFTFFTACKKDDDTAEPIPDRDRSEVYAEDLVEIENFLETHYYNYEEFQNNSTYSDTSTSPVSNTENDTFEIEYFEITDTTPPGTLSLMDMLNNDPSVTSNVLKFKMVTDNQGIEYKLYYLVVREGLGSALHQLDRAIVSYKGILSDETSFDSSPLPFSFNLTALGAAPGVVPGFREGLISFKTAETFTEDTSDGTVVYHNHGIGAVFIPSGLGYFSAPVGNIPPYSPIFFNFNLIDRNDTDYDVDNIPSHLEDLNGNGNGFDEDTDGDNLSNFFDNDDDGDGVLTRDEDLEDTDLNVDSDGDGDPTNDRNGDGNPLNDDTDGDGIPNYLDADTVISRL